MVNQSGSAPARQAEKTSVLVVGAGPVGLTLALELDRFGVDTLLIERNETTTRHPKMDITNGRSMELYRRLGVADDLRRVAVPSNHRVKVTWVTNAAGWELASFEYPSVDESRAEYARRNDGRLPQEPPMRVSQVVLEPTLRDLLVSRAEHVAVQYGWMLDSFTQDDDGVTAELVAPVTGKRRTVRARYLVGCDGAGSRTRRELGIGADEIDLRRLMLKELGVTRIAGNLVRSFRSFGQRPPDGRFYLVHFTTSDRRIVRRFGQMWHLQSPEGWSLISQDDGDIWTLHAPLGIAEDADRIDPREFVFKRLGLRFDLDVLVANDWTPRLVVADRFGKGRVWLAGDAVHQVTPTGGYGMNTGVGDAIGLGWALAALLKGWGKPGLLAAYEQERRAVAIRNRAAAGRHSVIRGAIMATFRQAMHSERWFGEQARREIGRQISDLGNLENEALGIEIGYRYDGSPAICSEDPTQAPPLRMDEYVPSTWPGARPPSVTLSDGSEIFDLFSPGFTLLRFADHDVTDLLAAASKRDVPFEIVDIRDAHVRSLYQRDLVLVRPDQHVAWRGNAAPENALAVIDRVRGDFR